MELHDPHLNGGIFTWFKGASHHSVARLDRFLYSMEWEELFRSIIQQIMLRVISDHNPIILQCKDWEQRKSYFKFENRLFNVEGFKDLTQVPGLVEWICVEGCPDYKFSMKLQMLKQKLKEWSCVTFGELTNRKTIYWIVLVEMDLIQNNRVLIEDEMIRAAILVELEELSKKWGVQSG